MTRTRRPFLVSLTAWLLSMFPISAEVWSQTKPIKVDPVAVVTIGSAESNHPHNFTAIVGATLLPNGHLLAADHGDYALLEFDQSGKLVRTAAKRGRGPGEVKNLRAFLRCGDSLFLSDIDGQKVSLFTPELKFVRSLRFASPSGSSTFEQSCNRSGFFVHYGWESDSEMKEGTFRPSVPFWLTAGGSRIIANLGNFPGSERFGLVVGGKLRGTRPLPFGRQSLIAVSAAGVYIATATDNAIHRFTLDGVRGADIRVPATAVPITQADVDQAIEDEILLKGKSWRNSVLRDYSLLRLPRTFPLFDQMIVDEVGLIWLRTNVRLPRGQVLWQVVDANGRKAAEVPLPQRLTIFEIGLTSILGRYIDLASEVPELRLYRIAR